MATATVSGARQCEDETMTTQPPANARAEFEALLDALVIERQRWLRSTNRLLPTESLDPLLNAALKVAQWTLDNRAVIAAALDNEAVAATSDGEC